MEFSRKDIEVGCRVLLQGIFPTQESNLSLLCLPRCWLLRAREDKSDVTYDWNYWKLLSSFDSHGLS